MSVRYVGERDGFRDGEAGPAFLKRTVEVAGSGYLCLYRKVVTAKEVDADVLEDQLPKGDRSRCFVGGISGNRAALLEHLYILIDVGRKGDLDNVINPV